MAFLHFNLQIQHQKYTYEGEIYENIDDRLMEAMKSMAGKSINLAVVGVRDSGKSTLISNILEKELRALPQPDCDDEYYPCYTTEHQNTINGVTLRTFEVPDPNETYSNDQWIKYLPSVQADILLFCMHMSRHIRINREDVNITRLLTKAFTPEMWKRAILVLMFADQNLTVPVDQYCEEFHKTLLKADVTTIPRDSIIAVPAGITLDNPPNWKKFLLLNILEIISPGVSRKDVSFKENDTKSKCIIS